MTKFSVYVQEIRAALLFASTDEDRYVLNGVHFELRPDRQPVIVSTDGRRLAVIATEAFQPDPPDMVAQMLDGGTHSPTADFTVSADFLKPLCMFAKTQGATLVVTYHPSKRVVFEMLEAHCVVDSEQGAVVEGDFPNWRQVVPSGESHKVDQFAVNSEYVGDFAKASKLLGVEVPGVVIHIFDETSAAEVHIQGKPNFYGIVMPMRAETKDEWQPEFLGMEAFKGEKPNVTDDGSAKVTIRTGETEVTISAEQLRKAAETIQAR